MSSHIKWKGQTLNQILTTIHRNENTTIISGENLKNAPPLKIYRKEIDPSKTSKSSKLGITINAFEIPNGYRMGYERDNSCITALDVKTFNEPDNQNNQNSVCFSPQVNAKKRIRTSGIIKHDYNMDNKQYLQRRCLSFEQNQYQFLQSGNSAVKPGSNASLLNVYTTQQNVKAIGREPKQVVYKPNNSQFAQNGAVTSSSLIARKKYNTITSNAHEYLLPYGAAVANAMSYGMSDSNYTYKSKISFPSKMTPKSNKFTNTMTFCENVKSRR
jgi:hypothetical protein